MASIEQLVSISELARIYGRHRQTVSKMLADMGAAPVEKRAGHPVYRLGDVTELRGDSPLPKAGELNPEELPPKDRKDWYQGESERLSIEREKGQLVPIDEVRREMAFLAKALVNELDNIPDILERDCNLDGESRERVQQIIDAARMRMHEAASE